MRRVLPLLFVLLPLGLRADADRYAPERFRPVLERV